MAIFTKVLTVTKDDLMVKLEGLTGKECYENYGFCEDETFIHTFKFDNGKEIDIKCIVGEEDSTTWYEGVVFNEKGGQIGYTDVEDSFLGEWYLTDNEGNEYSIIINLKKSTLFEICTALEFRHFVNKEQFDLDKEFHTKCLNREVKAIREHTNLPIEFKEVNVIARYNDGRKELTPVIRPTVEINSLEQLLELTKECEIVIDSMFYDVPSIKFYDSHLY